VLKEMFEKIMSFQSLMFCTSIKLRTYQTRRSAFSLFS